MVSKEISVLVTGGAGFIGVNLIAKLLKQGKKVICVDNLITGNLSNLEQFSNDQNFEFRELDVTTPFRINVDQIYNLACPASPKAYQSDPHSTLMTSVLGAKNTLDLAREIGATVLQASTSEVYGDPLVHPQTESYWGNVNPVGIRSCYDEGKRCAETMFYDYGRLDKVKTRIVRIFNTYGPYMSVDDGRVISNFIVQCLQNQDMKVYGDGRQTRSFCFVDDMTDGLIAAMESDHNQLGPINLGNPNEFQVLKLAEIIKSKTKSESEIVFAQLPKDDPQIRNPDISKVSRELGWTPKFSLDSGLDLTINYFNTQLKSL